MTAKQIARPFRLEREGHNFDVPTYASFVAASLAADKWREANPGKWWQIVERLNVSGTKRKIVEASK